MSPGPTPWYLVSDIDNIDSPALLLYLDRVKQNIALAVATTGDAGRLRPHVKTHKSPQVTDLLLQAGITKFKCATIAEAELLGRCGAPDVLLAYQPAGPKINRLLSLVQTFPATRFSCLLDAPEAAEALGKEAAARKLAAEVFIDVNTGMNRTGVQPEKAMELYRWCGNFPALAVRGLHAYDGHVTDSDLAVRRQKADEAFALLAAVRDQLGSAGFLDPVIVVGGSPVFPVHAARSGVECSPGTFVYWDWSYSESFPDMPFVPAALVASRVVSVVNGQRLCLDLGHKSVSAENPLDRRVRFLNAPGLIPVGHSEEHLMVEGPEAVNFGIGDVLYGLPFHICPTCALYDRAFVIVNGGVKEEWQTVARDRKLSI